MSTSTTNRIIGDMQFCRSHPEEFMTRNGYSSTSAMRTVAALNIDATREEFVAALVTLGYNANTVSRQFTQSRKLDGETTQ